MVGVVGTGEVAAAAVEAAGDDAVAGDADAVLSADPELVVAVGESALHSLVRAGVEVPVLPVDAGRGVESVPAPEVASAVESLLGDEWSRTDRRLLAISAGEREATALADAMLVTSEPVRISEYSVRAGAGVPDGAGDSAVDDARVAQFRADGVVVATPTGSRGYAHAAGGPVLAPGCGSVAVVPVAPFTTDRTAWVLDPPVEFVVERDESAVTLLVDDADLGPVPAGEPVTLRWGGSLALAVAPESRPFFEG